MNFLCDVHISRKVVTFLCNEGHQAIHVNDILQGDHTKDTEISFFATRNEHIVISKDKDFRDSFLLRQLPDLLLKIELGNLSTLTLIELLRQNLDTISSEMNSKPCMIELSKDSLKVFHPEKK